jgi:putative endonuclease
VKRWLVYVLRCGDGTLYTGITNDLERRLAQHRAGSGARYTRGRGPLRLLGSAVAGSRSDALRTEARIKRLPRRQKLAALRTSAASGHA